MSTRIDTGPHDKWWVKQEQEPRIGPYTLRVAADQYNCARCGARLEYADGALRCRHGHAIQGEADVKPRGADIISYDVRERIEADAFVQGYRRWSGEDAMSRARLNDRRNISTGLNRAGKIRMGYKVPVLDQAGKPRVYDSGALKGQPIMRAVNVDYFVLHDAPFVAEAYKGHPSVIKDQYGSGPSELLVFLPFNDVERIFQARYELRKGSILYCAGDGAFIQYALSQDGLHTIIRDGFAEQDYTDSEWSLSRGAEVRCPGADARLGDEYRLWQRCAKCTAAAGKPACTLRVMVRDPRNPIHVVADELAYYEIHTGSVVTYDLIVEQLDKLAEQARGQLTGIPLRLKRVPTPMSYVQTDRKGQPTKRAPVEHALMMLDADPAWVGVATERAYSLAMGLSAPVEREALPAGDLAFDGGYEVESDDEEYEMVEGVIENDTPEPEKQNGNGKVTTSGYGDMDDAQLMEHAKSTARPWPGDLAIAYLQKKARANTKPASAGKRGLLVGNLEKMLGEGENATRKRHELLLALFGATTSKTLTEGQAQALLDWIEKDEAIAYDEAERIIAIAAKARGQADMFADAAEPAPEGEATQPELDKWFGAKDKPSEEAAKAAIEGA